MKLLPLSLSLVVALAACAKPADTASTEAPAPSTTAATPATVASATAEAPIAEDAAFELSMATVDAWIAAQKNLALVSGDDEENDATMNASREDGVQYAARLQATPKFREAIEQAGLSTREFALTTESLLASMMAVGAVEAGALKEIPEGLNPQHIEFVKAHMAELEQKLQAMGSQD